MGDAQHRYGFVEPRGSNRRKLEMLLRALVFKKMVVDWGAPAVVTDFALSAAQKLAVDDVIADHAATRLAFDEPAVCNRSLLLAELRSALGHGAVSSIVWSTPAVVRITRSLTAGESAAWNAVVRNHDGAAANAAAAQDQVNAAAAAEQKAAAKQSLLTKLEAGKATPAEIQQALALALR